MRNYSILVCDDDQSFAQKVKQMIFYFQEDIIVKLVDDRSITFENQFDVYFLDIDMPTQSGFEVAKKIYERYPTSLILFLTSHEELSLEGYEYHAFRFISKERITQMFPKAMYAIMEALNEQHQYFDIKINQDISRIFLKDIQYLYSEGNYLNFYVKGELVRRRYTLKEFQEKFHNVNFVCPQKGFLVNIKNISKVVNERMIYMKDGDEIKISRGFKKEFMERYYHLR